MANANLLVPGTGGIKLIDNFGHDVGWPVLMRLKGIIRGVQGKSDDELIELMGMESRAGQLAPARSSLKPGTSLMPGHVLRVAYNQFDTGVNYFRYDWRADMRHSAAELLDFLRHRKPSDGRWNVVGHSQGGLLIVLASKLMDAEDDFSELVASATLVGSPVAGTLNSAEGMLVGDNAGKRLAPAIRATMRMWPGIYQMLPAWPSMVDANGQPGDGSTQLTDPGGWPGVEGIQDDLLLRAREAQALLKDPFAFMDGVDVRLYLADNRKTNRSLRLPSGVTLGWGKTATETGDTLVPYSTTMHHIGEACWPHVTTFMPPCEPHGFLLNDPSVASHVKARFQ